MGWPGPWELILVLIIVVMLFGAKRIPEIMGGLGKGIRVFKKTMEGEEAGPLTSSEPQPTEKKEPKKPDSTPVTPK